MDITPSRLELVRHDLQLLAVVLREFQILRIGPVGVGRAEGVNDADRVLLGVLAGRFGEDAVHELANAADALLPTMKKQ